MHALFRGLIPPRGVRTLLAFCIAASFLSVPFAVAAAKDPNLPSSRGTIRPAPPNYAAITELNYVYNRGTDSPPDVTIRYNGETTARPAVYLGFDDEGSWFLGRWVLVLKGDTFRIVWNISGLDDAPDDLHNGGPF
jgi:hypothetical protein